MNKTSYENGFEQGMQSTNVTWFEKGIEKERRETLREFLEARFGSLSPAVLARLENLPQERLQALRRQLFLNAAVSLADLGLED